MNECLIEQGGDPVWQQMARKNRLLDKSRWERTREKVEKWEMTDDWMTQGGCDACDWRCGDERKRKGEPDESEVRRRSMLQLDSPGHCNKSRAAVQ